MSAHGERLGTDSDGNHLAFGFAQDQIVRLSRSTPSGSRFTAIVSTCPSATSAHELELNAKGERLI